MTVCVRADSLTKRRGHDQGSHVQSAIMSPYLAIRFQNARTKYLLIDAALGKFEGR
jgi:hypothetical protein